MDNLVVFDSTNFFTNNSDIDEDVPSIQRNTSINHADVNIAREGAIDADELSFRSSSSSSSAAASSRSDGGASFSDRCWDREVTFVQSLTTHKRDAESATWEETVSTRAIVDPSNPNPSMRRSGCDKHLSWDDFEAISESFHLANNGEFVRPIDCEDLEASSSDSFTPCEGFATYNTVVIRSNDPMDVP